MWTNTQCAELLKIQFPLIQAPMAGAATPQLVAAVSNAGALGSLAAGYMSADEIRKSIQQIRALTNHSFAINLFIPGKHHATDEQIEKARKIVQASCFELNLPIKSIKPPYAPSFEEQMQVLFEEDIPILTFTFGLLSQHWIEAFKKKGTVLIGTATTLEEAKMLEESKVDAIVAQGSEAGGHRGTFIGKAEDGLINTSSLVQLLVNHIKIPIIAAGGLMDAKQILNTFMLGASAVQMGTAFLTCEESGIHPFYKKILLNSTEDETTLTRAFSGKLARGINNKFIMRMQSHQDIILDYPIQNSLTKEMRKEAAQQNCTDFMSMWAGQFAYLCKTLPAAQLIQELNKSIVALIESGK